MNRLCTDFSRNGGTFMIVRGEETLHSHCMNQVQRSMLATLCIPHLLKADLREVDFEVSIHYDITGLRMLSQCLKQEKISLNQLYSLLLQITKVLDDSKQYMLCMSNYVLDVNYIFVEEPLSLAELYFTYVPLVHPVNTEPVNKLLVNLITSMMPSVAEFNGSGVQQILRFCSDEVFSVSELKRRLLDLLSEEQPYTIREYMAPAVELQPSYHRVETAAGLIEPVALEDDYNPAVIDEEDAVQVEEVKEKSPTTYGLLGAILLSAIAWKFIYVDHPSTGSLYISVAVTIVLFVIYAGLQTGLIHKWILRKKVEIDERLELEDENIGGKRDITQNWRLGQLQPLGQTYQPEAMPRVGHLERSVGNQDDIFIESNHLIDQQIEVQPPPLQTVLLNRHPIPSQDELPKYCLERQDESRAQCERIPLSVGSFIIGRSPDLAQYVDTAAGVSRAHVELMITKNGCTLKDLGSRNGTMLAGEEIAPYKEYPLSDGDQFCIAKQMYTFRVQQ